LSVVSRYLTLLSLYSPELRRLAAKPRAACVSRCKVYGPYPDDAHCRAETDGADGHPVGFRRAKGATAYPHEVKEAALAHAVKKKAEAHRPLREASRDVDAWADFATSAVAETLRRGA
jgi:hypothetical protein